MVLPSSLSAARLAKEVLLRRYGESDWFRGVGIAPAPDGFAVRLNVDEGARNLAGELPDKCEGVPVEVIYLQGYSPRETAGQEK